MKWQKTFVFVYILFITQSSCVWKQTRNVARLDRFVECGSTPNVALLLKEVKYVNPPGRNFIISVKAVLLRPLRTGPNFEAYVTRCSSKEALDTCQLFTVLKPVGSTCNLAAMTNAPWADTIKKIHPPFKCPLKPGHYELINGTVDADLFRFFPIANYYWKAKINFIEDVDRLSICAEFRAIKVYV